jgi:hypothetical protein
MRKIWIALGVVACMGGVAAATETELAPTASQATVTVHRYAFNGLGRSPEQAAAELCGAGQVASTRTHRTMGDAAAMVFTAFWYTPEHVTVECAPVAPVR